MWSSLHFVPLCSTRKWKINWKRCCESSSHSGTASSFKIVESPDWKSKWPRSLCKTWPTSPPRAVRHSWKKRLDGVQPRPTSQRFGLICLARCHVCDASKLTFQEKEKKTTFKFVSVKPSGFILCPNTHKEKRKEIKRNCCSSCSQRKKICFC